MAALFCGHFSLIDIFLYVRVSVMMLLFVPCMLYGVPRQYIYDEGC